MKLILRVQSPGESRSVAYRVGQVVQIGRTEWANLCLPSDTALADVHCEIVVASDACRLRSLSPDAITSLNGQPITEEPLKHGDQISVGSSQITVEIEGQAAAPAAEPPPVVAAPISPESAPERMAAPVCAVCEIDLAEYNLDENATASQFANAALDAERFADFARFACNMLSKQEAVWWAIGCVEHAAKDLPAEDAAALDAARSWVTDDSDENRRLAGRAAGKSASAAEQIALAVFWSGGSINEPDGDPIPPDELMTQRMLAGAILSAAFLDEEQDPTVVYRAFGQLALAVASGENHW